jgi:hypothetical protein
MIIRNFYRALLLNKLNDEKFAERSRVHIQEKEIIYTEND